MPVNGWLGLTWDLRGNQEVEPDADERRRELSQLRRAVVVARRTGPQPVPAGAPAELRRATVEAQQAILRHALRTGDIELVRRAARALRVSHLAGDPGTIEALLAVMRDTRSVESDVLDAAAQLADLPAASAAAEV